MLVGCFLQPVTAQTAPGAKVLVSQPATNVVSSPVHFVASATTGCNNGVSAMGIYTAPGKLAYVVNGAKLDTDLTLSVGNYDTVVQEWDNCGGAASTDVPLTVIANPDVSSPIGKLTLSPVHYVATAITTCAKGVAAIGIYTAPGNRHMSLRGRSWILF
jgi:phospholipase C